MILYSDVAMPHYDDSLRLREALAEYFEANGFGDDGGYNDKWVSGKFGPIPFAFPNTEARRRAVPLHDLHHVITGYGTDGVGEGEISAWEIAGSCADHWAAWFLNLNAMWLGSLFDRRAVWRAFLRGRKSRNYYAGGVDEATLDAPLAAARDDLLGPDSQPIPGASERAAFAGWWLVGLLLVLAQLGLVVAPVALFARWLIA